MSGKTNFDHLQTIFSGAMGAMSFGAYHQYTTNKIMELNNEKQNLQTQYILDKLKEDCKKETERQEIQNKIFLEKIKEQHNEEMVELNKKISKLENRWW
jgi:hypothetical protein